MSWFSRWRRRRILERHLIPATAFDAAVARLPILRGLTSGELIRLREAASLFLHDKTFSGAGGAEVDDAMQLAIAVQACLLTLNLDENSYRGWSEIILYPDEFLRPREEMDEAGVVHHSRDILSGESWLGGPLVLSLADVAAGGQADGFNVVLHEFAHKLDMLDGTIDGTPLLPRDVRADWVTVCTDVYDDLVAGRPRPPMRWYGATNPGEFFAVATEVFFEQPKELASLEPALYDLLARFYRQDPAVREERLQ